MKKFFSSNSVAKSFGFLRRSLLISFLLPTLISCIYDASGDKFYRTLWTAEDPSLGKITIEFLCGNQISATITKGIGSFGYYDSDGNRAHFTDLTITKNGETYIIEEATREGDLLTINWHPSVSRSTTYSTLRRLSAYE